MLWSIGSSALSMFQAVQIVQNSSTIHMCIVIDMLHHMSKNKTHQLTENPCVVLCHAHSSRTKLFFNLARTLTKSKQSRLHDYSPGWLHSTPLLRSVRLRGGMPAASTRGCQSQRKTPQVQKGAKRHVSTVQSQHTIVRSSQRDHGGAGYRNLFQTQLYQKVCIIGARIECSFHLNVPSSIIAVSGLPWVISPTYRCEERFSLRWFLRRWVSPPQRGN